MTLPERFMKAHSAGDVFWPKGTDQELQCGVPLLVFCDDWVRWWSLEEISGFEPPEYWRPELALTPFASNPYGDYWSFLGRATDAAVVLVAHDENETRLFAPSFEAFLFRKALEGLGEHRVPEPTRLDHERASVEALRPYLRGEYLADLSARLAESQRNPSALLENARSRLEWPRFDATFEHEAALGF